MDTHSGFLFFLPLPTDSRRHSSRPRSHAFLHAFALFFLLLLPFSATAGPPQRFIIEDARFAPHEDILYFTCSIAVDEESGLHDILKDGAVLELTVDVSLERHRSWWTNSEVAEARYTSVLRHDPLSRDFIIVYPAASGEELTRDRNLTRLLSGHWRKLELPVTSMETIRELGTDRDYILIARFSLRHTEVPPWLQSSVGFWSSEVVSDQKVTLEFHY